MNSSNIKKNKKILITGINGFIGSSCARYFAQKNYEIFGIDILGEKTPNFIQGEVSLNNLMSFNQEFDIIIHLAGSGTVASVKNSPEIEYQKNVQSSNDLLEYMRCYNSSAKLIYSSSAAVYGDSNDNFITEKNILSPISDYGKLKLEVEKLCEEYSKKFDLNINIIRFFSIYGEGLKKQLLWDVCTRIYKNPNAGILNCFGTGEEKRDFIHINNAIQLIEILINNDSRSEIVNGGTGEATSVEYIFKLICNELHYVGDIVFDNIIREGDPKSIIANIEKALSLGFKPTIKIEDGIKEYVKWFKKNQR